MSDFEVEILADDHDASVTKVSVTHNGYQWTSLRLHGLEELRTLRDAINMKLLESE